VLLPLVRVFPAHTPARFKDDADRDNLLDRLGNILSETQTACLAWAKLKISQPAVSLAVRRGEQLAHRNRYSLKD
jgi:hypothetical protein